MMQPTRTERQQMLATSILALAAVGLMLGCFKAEDYRTGMLAGILASWLAVFLVGLMGRWL